MIQTLMLAALSVARERENGTFDQLLVTPFSPTEILIGKAVPITLIGLDAVHHRPASGGALVPNTAGRLAP